MHTHLSYIIKKFSILCMIAVFCTIPLFVPATTAASTAEDLGIGTIDVPPGVEKYQAEAASQGATIGLVYFMSNMIKLFSIIAGVWVLFNGILAGYFFITSSGDSSGYEKAKNQITQSAIGLALIMFAYTATGIVGLIFFGDAGIFLNPTLE